MNDTKDILKFINGTLSEKDKDRVKLWIDSSDENYQEYMFMKSISIESENLDDIRLFDEEKEWEVLEGMFESEDATKVVTLKSRLIRIIGIAASFLLVFVTINYIFNQKPLYQDFVNNNKSDTIRLVDGSVVYLEKNSKIKYFTRIDGNAKQRYVEVEGKARFEISKSKDLPFVVQSGDAGVSVLGTIFSVDNSDSGVSVENFDGLIKLFEWVDTSNSMILKKGDKAVFKDGGIKKVLPPKPEPEIMPGEYHKIEDVIEYLFDKYETRTSTAPYAQIDMDEEVFVDFNQPLEGILLQLDTTAKLQYRKTCRNCYEISVLKPLR